MRAAVWLVPRLCKICSRAALSVQVCSCSWCWLAGCGCRSLLEQRLCMRIAAGKRGKPKKPTSAENKQSGVPLRRRNVSNDNIDVQERPSLLIDVQFSSVSLPLPQSVPLPCLMLVFFMQACLLVNTPAASDSTDNGQIGRSKPHHIWCAPLQYLRLRHSFPSTCGCATHLRATASMSRDIRSSIA